MVSKPSGATIAIDGVDKGITPARIRNLAPGSHLLKVPKEGYYPKEGYIKIRSGFVTFVNVVLRPIRRGDMPTAIDTISSAEIVDNSTAIA